MHTFRWTMHDKSRLVLWLSILTSVSATAAIFAWLSRWVPPMRAVSLVGAVIAIFWLWTPACKRWFARRRNRTP